MLNKEILRELRALRRSVDGRVERMEELLAKTTDTVTRIQEESAENSADIKNLYRILEGLVARGTRKPGGVVVPKEELYSAVEASGIPARQAVDKLREAGAIAQDGQGKNTVVVRIEGRPTRVILVKEAGTCRR